MKENRAKWIHYVGVSLTVLIFVLAVLMLRGELKHYPLPEIIRHLKAISKLKLISATLLSLGGYLTLTGYDLLAFRYLKRKLAFPKIMMTAFTGFAVGNNIGLANLAGTAVRYRLYSGMGVEGSTVAEVVILNMLSNWLGFFLAMGSAFTIIDPPLPDRLHLPFSHARPVGFLFLIVIVAYVLLVMWRKTPLNLGKWRVPIPKNRTFAFQVVVGCFDFVMGAFVLYVLLPANPPFTLFAFVGIFMVANSAAIISHVPGGLGVFETVILFLLTPALPGPTVLSALIAYRTLFFLLPLVIGLVILAGFELTHQQAARTPLSSPLP